MRNENGFTLLEVLIAIGILSIGIIATMQMFPHALRQAQVAAERTAAAAAANSQLGRLRSLSEAADVREWIKQNTLRTLDTVDATYALYNGWSTSVQRVSDSDDTFRVTFNVQMLDGRTETFVTYVTKR